MTDLEKQTIDSLWFRTLGIRSIRVHFGKLLQSGVQPCCGSCCKGGAQKSEKEQRDIRRAIGNTGTGTKSQQALKLQQEQNKQERKEKSREQKLAEDERKYILKQQKKKEKHRAR